MNPVFIILVFIGGGLLWILSSFLFRPIGKMPKKLINDAKEAMFENENETEDKN